MSRIPRSRLGSGVFHVINRAIDRRFIFADDEDKKRFVDCLVEAGANHPLRTYHWVVMSNHFHLAVEALDVGDLSKWLGSVSHRYTRHYHKRHGGSGPLWQGRFKSILVQKEGYLGKLGRYIERNPVRAGMVEQAWDYRWSSAQAYLSDESDALVNPSDNGRYQSMGKTSEDRRETYVQYLLSSREREDDETLFRAKAAVIGDETFKANVQLRGGRLAGRRQGRPRKPKPSC